MRDVLVGVFTSAEHARAAHATLLEHGFRGGQVGVEPGAPAPAEQGFAALVARMFSGFLQRDDPRGRAYAERIDRGGGIVALHDLDAGDAARARAILQQHGAADVASHAPARGAAQPVPDGRAGRELAAVASVGGPQAYVLPNAPSDWGRFTGRGKATIGDAADPARPPEGELTDAVGLDPEADREALRRRAEQRRR